MSAAAVYALSDGRDEVSGVPDEMSAGGYGVSERSCGHTVSAGADGLSECGRHVW